MRDWKMTPARDVQLSARQRHRYVWREGGLIESVLRLLWWSSVRTSLTVCHRLELRGREHIPAQAPFILAANHESHLDALVIGAAVPLRMRDQLVPLAAGDVFFEVPAVAAFSALALNALPLWRRSCGRHGLGDLRDRLLGEACVYILFPEGTRTRTGAMGPFRPGIGMLVAGTPVPVVPCYLDGPFRAFPPGTHWPRFRKISARFGPALTFEEVENKRDGWKTISAEIENAVKRLALLASGETTPPTTTAGT